jgi:hypothetical protein
MFQKNGFIFNFFAASHPAQTSSMFLLGALHTHVEVSHCTALSVTRLGEISPFGRYFLALALGAMFSKKNRPKFT